MRALFAHLDATQREVLARRAERLREVDATPPVAAHAVAVVLAFVGDEQLALAAADVQALERDLAVSGIVEAPSPWVGMAVVRGAVHAVFDLGLARGRGRTDGGPLVLVDACGPDTVAVRVSSIAGFKSVAPSALVGSSKAVRLEGGAVVPLVDVAAEIKERAVLLTRGGQEHR